jgi:hypothetical protein
MLHLQESRPDHDFASKIDPLPPNPARQAINMGLTGQHHQPSPRPDAEYG